MKTWYYSIPNDKPGEGWAQIILTSNGIFAAVSDWGDYAHKWNRPGVKDFREFFFDVERSWDYYVGKLNPNKVLNEAESWKAAKKYLLERRREKSLTAEQARSIWDNMDYYSSWEEYLDSSDVRDLNEEPWEFSVYEWDPQTVSFVKRVLPRLWAILRAELKGEKAHTRYALSVKVVDSKNFHITPASLKGIRESLEGRLPGAAFQDFVEHDGGNLYPRSLGLEGVTNSAEAMLTALSAFEGRADIVVVWSTGEHSGYRLRDHVVTEVPVSLSLP